jgi:hypothetical protein
MRFPAPLRTLLLATCAALLPAAAQDAQPQLVGRVEGRSYVSPTGIFKVTIPVLAELGGEVTDTPNVVTFQDDYSVHVSIAAFPHDATQRWELATRGPKDYLVYFFSNFVLSDFRQAFPNAKIESAKFLPATLDGALLTYMLVPGGTMFANRVPQVGISERIPVAKRGNLLFVRNGHTFILSTELAERVIEGSSFKKTTEEEDELLRTRLLEIVGRITFSKPTDGAKPAEKK